LRCREFIVTLTWKREEDGTMVIALVSDQETGPVDYGGDLQNVVR
jgi:hypothetical protein